MSLSLALSGSILPMENTALNITQALFMCIPGNTKGGSITVPLTSGLTGLESAV
jgi:hypothetical protein